MTSNPGTTTETLESRARALAIRHHATCLKIEFEAEGATLEEVHELARLARAAQLGLCVKIGGPEAIRDIRDAIAAGATRIVAPMIESPFAVKKFVHAYQDLVVADDRTHELAVVFESIWSFALSSEILAEPSMASVSRIVVGRTDMARSCDEPPSGPTVTAMVAELLTLARESGKRTAVGGSMSTDAIDPLLLLWPMLDEFESRNVIFEPTERERPEIAEAIRDALLFEEAWIRHRIALFGARHGDIDRLSSLALRAGSVPEPTGRHASSVEAAGRT